MDETIAILGRQPALGIAELESLYGSSRLSVIGAQTVRLKIAPCSIDFSRLGGILRLCKLLTVLETTNWKEVEKFLLEVSPGHAGRMPPGKMHLGLSVYGLPSVSERQLLATGLSLKKAIHQASGRSVHLVPNKEPILNTAQVAHNKLIGENGWELIFVSDGNKTIVAQTVAVQDIESYTLRDRGRPRRDARVGMLPPKLAQTLINLATGPDEFAEIESTLSNDVCLSQEDNIKMRAQRAQYTLLDPFCGTGVVLQEALLMGYRVQGTDLEPRMIDYTKQNLDWLTRRFNLQPAAYTLSSGDAITIHWRPPVDLVASELYLGRPFTTPPASDLLAQTIAECNVILEKFLRNLSGQLASGTRLCLAVPAWQIKAGTFRDLPLIDHLSRMGYNRVSFEHVRDDQLLYYREDQIVARRLLVLTRK
jgi:tRNA G10  N-methylase Trm11